MNGKGCEKTSDNTVGDEMMVEVNTNASPRTLHFFWNGIQEKPFFTNIPPSLKFAVSPSPLFSAILSFPYSILLMDETDFILHY
jgi:hypothetical protein